jgi:hypothetical protein
MILRVSRGREALGVRGIPALSKDVLGGSKRKRRDAAHSKRFARFGCGFAALRGRGSANKGNSPDRMKASLLCLALNFL